MAEYTIREIRFHDDAPFVLLREVVNVPCVCFNCDKETAFSAYGFRPLVSAEHKNEHVIELLKKFTERKPVRASIGEAAKAFNRFAAAIRSCYTNQ